jgi:hypothetical protein
MVDTATAPPTSDTRPWGFHAIMDCTNCNLEKITDIANINAWLVNTLQETKLTAVGTASVVAADAGYIAVQILTTGTITAQFVNADSQVYIDVFSNTEYNPVNLETSIKTFFGVVETDIKKILIPRNATV